MMKQIELRKIEPIDVMRYYVTYKDVESKIISTIDSKKLIEREQAYHLYTAKHMKIARNFKKGTSAMVLGTTKNHYKLGSIDITSLSDAFYRGGLLSGNNKNAFVAASKLLCLFDHNVIIMDRVALGVLHVKSNNYNDFVAVWKAYYKIFEPMIVEVIEQYNFATIDPIMKKKWFRMRVFDQFLISQ